MTFIDLKYRAFPMRAKQYCRLDFLALYGFLDGDQFK